MKDLNLPIYFTYFKSVLSPDWISICPLMFPLGEIVGKHGT